MIFFLQFTPSLTFKDQTTNQWVKKKKKIIKKKQIKMIFGFIPMQVQS